MAEAFLSHLDKRLEVFSAGFSPDLQIDPKATEVMLEAGIDIRTKSPKPVSEFEGRAVDYLITICDSTTEKIDPGNVQYKHKINLVFADPARHVGKDESSLDHYRDVRDEIKNELEYFYNRILMPQLIHS
jgi:arsenate reductase